MGRAADALNPTAPGVRALQSAPGGARQPPHAPARLGFRSVYILPTRQGMSLAAALAVMLLGSINYDNALGYGLTFLLAGVSLVSMLHACRNLTGLTVRAGESQAVFAGGQAAFTLVLDNREQAARHGLVARYGGTGRRRSRDDRVVHFDLPANAVARIELPLPAPRRGWLTPGRVVLATRFPFGLFRAWSVPALAPRCLVYPRPRGHHPLPANGVPETGGGAARGGGREDFAGLRDYAPGDSPRHIHWKAVARGQGVPVKLFTGAADGVLVLRLGDAPGGDLEQQLEQLCRWILEAQSLGVRYGLELPGVELAPDNGEAHQHACLRALALYRIEDGRTAAAGGAPS
ncbi:MAG: DUF58 domain-containing protein [Gammaproteobacteria bacterium]|nr:DUF58 domain-containing protein [Gammaproteobacteria bacterium]